MLVTLEMAPGITHLRRGGASMSDLGHLMRRRRGELGITQPQLADAIGVDQSYVSQIETGKVKRPNDALLKRIATTLDIAYNEVLSAAGYVVRVSDPETVTGGASAWIPNWGRVPTDSAAWAAFGQRGHRVQIPMDWVDQTRATLFAVEVLDSGLPHYKPAISHGDVVVLESRDPRRQLKNGVAVLARVGDDYVLATYHRLGLRIQLRDGDDAVICTLEDGSDMDILGSYFKRFDK